MALAFRAQGELIRLDEEDDNPRRITDAGLDRGERTFGLTWVEKGFDWQRGSSKRLCGQQYRTGDYAAQSYETDGARESAGKRQSGVSIKIKDHARNMHRAARAGEG